MTKTADSTADSHRIDPAVADATADDTKKEYRRDLTLVAEGIGPDKVSLFLGGMLVASDLALLHRYRVTTVINCAVNLDINYVDLAQAELFEGKLPYGRAAIRSFKLGMIDGPGNSDSLLAAGYLLLHGALNQDLPVKESYPVRERGNVLVHCRGGRSRSVIVVALYLHLEHPERFPTLDAAIAEVRSRRGLTPDEWHETPKTVLVEAAQRVTESLRRSGLAGPMRQAGA